MIPIQNNADLCPPFMFWLTLVEIFSVLNSDFKSRERTDLNVQTKDYESIWVEISNDKSKNIVCGCIYRHPMYQQADFLEYMDSTLHKITKENKEIYLCGDFNIDFLQTDTEKNSTDFYALLSSNGLLPYIVVITSLTWVLIIATF